MSDLAAALEAGFRHTVPVVGSMGVEVAEANPGRVRLRLPYQAGNGNHLGTVFAGVLYSFLETCGGALVLVSLDIGRWLPVIVESTVRFRRPVTGTLEAEMALGDGERHAIVRALEADPRYRWELRVAATDETGAVACEADHVYRFSAVGTT